jgi:F-type H+-transporting ATPase subunit delta
MSITRIASRYAKSLLDLAVENKNLERVLEDVQLFKQSLENRDLFLVVKSPIIKAEKKLVIFNEIFKGKVDDLTLSFIQLVTSKGRESILPEITDQFIEQYRELNNITLASFTTSREVPDTIIDSLVKELKSSTWVRKGEVEVQEKVDQDIIGGFIIEIDNKQYDASVKAKLAELKKEILDNTYIKSL